MPATTYLVNKLVDHQLGTSPYTSPTVYVGMSSTTPALNGTGVTEPSGGGYARVATSSSTFSAAVAGASANTLTITFPMATADWVGGANLTYGLAYDAPTGGNLLFYGTLAVASAVVTGAIATITPGGMTASLT